MITVRPERPTDASRIYDLNAQAFETDAEAKLVDRLRESCVDFVSLVAEDESGIVGHILFTPVLVDAGDRTLEGMGLAPMAVAPDRQRAQVVAAPAAEAVDLDPGNLRQLIERGQLVRDCSWFLFVHLSFRA